MKNMKNKNPWVVPLYGIIYLIFFFALEKSQVNHQVLQSSLDDMIPFCEYFIVPYVLWYVFILATVVYFLVFNESVDEYCSLIAFLGSGMTVFLIVSFVYPNCHNLRPDLSGVSGNIFIEAVKLLHVIDTSTNVFPSIHVFNTLVCMAAIFRNERCKRHKWVLAGTGVLSASIILSTVFLKQHSVVDVVGGVILFAVCYYAIYRLLPAKKDMLAPVFRPGQILTIPNILSMFRLVLAIVFWGIGIRKEFPHKQACLVGTLIISGITDFLDGKIARKYNMVSELGKLLDPVADKVTQGVLLLYLVNKYPLIQLTLILFVVKEASMLIVSSKVLELTQKNDGAKWYGKISTAVFYVVMIVLVLFPQISLKSANCLIGISSFFMALAFIMYMNQYFTEYQTARQNIRPAG